MPRDAVELFLVDNFAGPKYIHRHYNLFSAGAHFFACSLPHLFHLRNLFPNISHGQQKGDDLYLMVTQIDMTFPFRPADWDGGVYVYMWECWCGH